MFCIGGNSYMNIIAICLYLVRIALIGVAIGILYIRCGLFNKLGKTFIMMIGIASSPMFLSFVLYIMGFFIGGAGLDILCNTINYFNYLDYLS